MRHSNTSILLSVILIIGACDRSQQNTQQTSTTMPTATIIYKSPDGRVLTFDQAQDQGGVFKYEIIGNDQVPEEARSLHQQARQLGSKGEYDKAIDFLKQASLLAPSWPYPVYDMAYSYLLKEDYDNARLYYQKTIDLSPRGFFTALTAVDILNREKKGEFQPGLFFAYSSLEWMGDNPKVRDDLIRQLAEKQPTFAPGLMKRSQLEDDPAARLMWIEKGLAANPDGDTKGMLILNKALCLNIQGKRDDAVKLLGELALDPNSTFGSEQLAKETLYRIMTQDKK